ncbi:tetratricopeptide repeat protein [Psychrosphaera aestuarii]|uniref:tetratricopeptide repeat protein n=1 Tax=Psychrosphaera aestuarii TaxID=1266052 RepID=UPI001B31C375|nr:tetratricopeptide repeat protein [Psychrosphaera aestuarii]
MSVINKMLKDLDNRQEQPETMVKSGPANSSSTSNTTMVGKGSIALLVVIVILLATISWQIFNGTPAVTTQPTSTLPSSQKVIDGVVVEIEPTVAEPVAADISDISDISDIPEIPEIPDVAEQVPAESTDVLPAEPESVQVVMEPAAQSAPEPTPELDELTEKEANSLTTNLVTDSTENSSNNVATESSRSTSSTSTAKNAEVTTPPKPSTAEQPPVFIIEKTSSELTPQERIAKLLSKAKESYDRGYVTEAIEQLTRILSISDSNVEARNLLAAAWYGRGEGNKAISIINDGLQRYPLIEEWRVTAAKIFFKDNNAAGAFSYLDVNLESASKEFYTLKGNLARELKYFAKAEAAYAQLTKLEPFVGNWWLGLAIAQDSLGKASDAISSYKKVLDVGGVSSQSMSFSQNRIDVLQG